MSDNKFIKHLRGEDTVKSVLEIKNQRTTTSFANMPDGDTSNANDVYSDHRGNATGVLKGTENWKLDGQNLVETATVYGDGRDFTNSYNVFGNNLWVDASFTFATARRFNKNTKFVLKLCGHDLDSAVDGAIDFTLLVKFGSTVITKSFRSSVQAFNFCKEFVVDFAESNTTVIKLDANDTMQIQLLCGDATAQAVIYNGMTVFTALQRRVDGDAVASDKKTFDEVVQDIDDINEDISDIRENIDDLENYVDDTFVKKNGSSVMTAPLKFQSGSMRGAVGPYLNGVSFWKMDSQYTITNIANLTDSRFLPITTNSIDLGRSANTWKDLYLGGKVYVATLNNGADLTVPNKSGTLATMVDVELAARSGRMLTDQGVRYAKMYSATVPPAADNGTNYADFSQVDGDNNPIIVIYERQSGAWVQTETITPPAEYDGYVSITSKIWDIAEQSGQQGGRVLWNHTSKEFTPYPVIISFEDIEITGNSTVIMPVNPSVNQIANKKYVDDAIAAIPTPTVDIKQSIDADIVGTLTVASNGDVSGLDNSNYLVYPGALDMSDASSFEMVFAFTTGNAVSRAYVLTGAGIGYGSEHNIAITINSSEKLYFYVNASSDFITGTTTIQPNTKYYVKVVYDGTDYILSLSEDGNNWNTEGSVLATEKPGPLRGRKYAIGRSVASVFSAMHLKECYIKENNILVWQGMDAPGLHQRIDTNASNVSALGKLNIIDMIMPDYANVINNVGYPYTPTKDGVYLVYTDAGSGSDAVTVDGVVFDILGPYSSVRVPVSAGTVCTVTGSITAYAKFIPFKGA